MGCPMMGNMGSMMGRMGGGMGMMNGSGMGMMGHMNRNQMGRGMGMQGGMEMPHDGPHEPDGPRHGWRQYGPWHGNAWAAWAWE